MELSTLVLAVVAIIVIISLGKMIFHSLRFILAVLVVVLVLIFVFGISFGDLVNGITALVLWVF